MYWHRSFNCTQFSQITFIGIQTEPLQWCAWGEGGVKSEKLGPWPPTSPFQTRKCHLLIYSSHNYVSYPSGFYHQHRGHRDRNLLQQKQKDHTRGYRNLSLCNHNIGCLYMWKEIYRDSPFWCTQLEIQNNTVANVADIFQRICVMENIAMYQTIFGILLAPWLYCIGTTQIQFR